MTKSTRTLRTFAAAAGVVALIGTASACANASDDSEPERKGFALDGSELTIDSSDSKVVVRPADVKEVRVTRWFDGWAVFGDTPKATWSMNGHTLTFRTQCRGAVQDCSVRHEVLVPRGVRLTVVNGDGSVEASGFSTPLDLTTRDGSVVVRDVTGPLRLSSGDGRIDAGGIGSREVSVHTSDGSVKLAFDKVPDLVEATSGDGRVSLALPHQSYKVSARSGDGHVSVDVPRDDTSGHVVTVRTGDGSVSVTEAGR
ncbi:DUF4097 family beta strand repeat-containing protein [Actinacidiphila glaucinigra]|uniref:DUF4097 family beta strand repeat-containing protein n=1 Tax=Actinacidiphila glaucinigra TaxID=235986 RepID=UPI0036E7D40A